MPFKTKLDYSSNRQIKQHIETFTVLSGGTTFGVPFSALTSGPDLLTSGFSQTYFNLISTFSGNSGTTIYSWFDPRMSLGESTLSAITPSNSGITQNTGQVYTASSTTIIDGNTVVLSYTGVSFNITVTGFTNLGGGNYSGNVFTNILHILSANTLDYSGRTIWVDVAGITRTKDLIITKNPVIGNVWTCIDGQGKGGWSPSSGGTSGGTGTTSYWSASTGPNAIVINNSGSIASGILSLGEGFFTTASGNYSHAEGIGSIASNDFSHAEGNSTAIGLGAHAEGSSYAFGDVSHSEGQSTSAMTTYSHAEGYYTIASGQTSHSEGDTTTAIGTASHSEGYSTRAIGGYSHAEGEGTIASGLTSHAEGLGTTAIGDRSHAGGYNTIASGLTSFVHGENSEANGDFSIVLGRNITGNTTDYVYVSSLNIKTVGSSAFANDIRIDATGNLTTNTSDIRFKENISSITNALDKIKQLRGISYQWKDRIAGGDSLKLGFIAQEVEIVEPILTFTNKVDGYKGIHIDGIIPLLVEAVKELASGVTTSGNVYLETQTILAEDNNIELNYSGNPQTAIGGGIRVLHAIGQDLAAEMITNSDGNWITNNDFKAKALTIPLYTPSSSNDEYGNEGNITRDNNFIYLKTENNWKRIKLEDF